MRVNHFNRSSSKTPIAVGSTGRIERFERKDYVRGESDPTDAEIRREWREYQFRNRKAREAYDVSNATIDWRYDPCGPDERPGQRRSRK